MESQTVNKRRIAKNTLMLYIRMFIMLAVGLYTSRVVLQALGATDYGIYNIIGGVVVLFSFLNGSLTSATRRFLNFNLGKKDYEAVHKVFCMSMNIYFILAFVIFVLAETIGLWFVETKLNIPPERSYAASWVYQFTIITFIINLLRIPYNASITAYERMDFYAYISLAEVTLKLLVVYFLYTTSYDKLIIYAFLYTLVPFIITIIYKFYCNRKFETTRYKKIWDKDIFLQMFSFSGWSLFGSAANMSAQQGLNILINLFHGVTANTAVGIANQVSSNVYQFISNFQTAFHPQIIKSYAAQETASFYKLICQTSKFSYYMMFILAFPILLTTQTLLTIWLTDVPEYTSIFCQLILGYLIVEGISTPLWMAVHATGNIKRYQIIISLCIFLNFPLTYFAFKCNLPIYTVWIIRIVVNIITLIIRCFYLKQTLSFPIKIYIKEAIIPILSVTIISMPIPLLITVSLDNSILNCLFIIITSFINSILTIYFIGLSDNERAIIKLKILGKFSFTKK